EIKKGNISDDELNYSKNDLITSLRSVSDSAVAIKDWNLGKLLRNITTTPEKEIESIKTVTKEDVSKCAEKIKLDTVFILRNNKEKEATADE
ncbi:MAG: insulinase family protein, partial [Clostridia bacterium]|nr:insulinase family protein [Clostridia bacterium]